MAVSVSTTAPTCFTAKSTANDQSDTTHWDGADANNINSQFQLIVQNMSRSQTITLDSTGTTTFTPTWAGTAEDPAALSWTPKTKTASGLLHTGYAVTVLTATGITVTHGSYSQDLTSDAIVTVIYQ